MKTRVIGQRPASGELRRMQFARVLRGPGPLVPIKRRELPYWQQQGWWKDGTGYSGRYQTVRGAFLGWIEQNSQNEFDYYIFQPPEELASHSHWTCFQDRGGPGWYYVHMAVPPADLSSGIMAVERILTEAYQSAHRSGGTPQ